MKIHPATATEYAWVEFDTEDEAEIEAIALELQDHRRAEGVRLSVEEAADLLMLAEARAEEYGTEEEHPCLAALRSRLRAAEGHEMR